MADVTGPIRTLPGAGHSVPDGQMCDEHPDRPAVARIQGETDSFGCEMIDMCEECLKADREWHKSDEAVEWRKGKCEWCKRDADDLRDARDYEEGMAGRVYRVCGGCAKRQEDRIQAELDAYDDDRDEPFDDMEDSFDECGMMSDGQCLLAGTEQCDWDCPRDRPGRNGRQRGE